MPTVAVTPPATGTGDRSSEAGNALGEEATRSERKDSASRDKATSDRPGSPRLIHSVLPTA